MDGFTVVLIDNGNDPSEGDFVYVESFDSAEALGLALDASRWSETSPLGRALMQAAEEIEERDRANA